MTDTDRTDLRTKMLADATAHRDNLTAEGRAAVHGRDTLRAELAKITAELTAKITAETERIRDLNAQANEADALVRSLTPRKPRTTKPAVDHHAALLDTYDTDNDQ